MIGPRKSLATGVRFAEAPAGMRKAGVAVDLYDGAAAAPIHPKWSPDAVVLLNGVETFVCTGPAGPLPEPPPMDAWERERRGTRPDVEA